MPVDRRAGRDRGHDLARRPVLVVPVPRRPGRAQRRHRRRGGRRGLPGQPGGRGARLAAAALDRRPVLRHLPVALPGHRADHAGQQHRGPARAAGRSRRASGSPHCPGSSSRSRSARRHRAGLAPRADPAARRARRVRGWPRRPARPASSWWPAPGLAGVVAVPARRPSAAALGAGSGALSESTNSVSHAAAGTSAGKSRVTRPGVRGAAAERAAAHVLHVGRAYRRLDL